MALEVGFKSRERALADHLLSISEVSRRTGVQSSALRYYESAGLVRSQSRIGGRRHYDPSILRRLAVIALLQEVGFTLGEIKDLVDSSGHDRWMELAKEKLGQIDRHLKRVQSARNLLETALRCECECFDRCDLTDQRQGHHGKLVRRMTF